MCIVELNRIYEGSALDVLKTFEPESIDMVCTSPPYYALRDYKMEEQIGNEKTPQEYIKNLMAVLKDCKRVLKKTGSLWINIGDTYASGGGKAIECSFVRNSVTCKDDRFSPDYPGKAKLRAKMGKSLLAIPERLVITMYDEGWIRRNTIIWHKPNCMPSSAKDRFTIDFEYFYFFTKSQKYWFETQYEPYGPLKRWGGNAMKLKSDGKLAQNKNASVRGDRELEWHSNPSGRIKRAVWNIKTQPFPEAHF